MAAFTTRMGIKILQINVGRSRVAQDLAYATARERSADILIINEPNRNMVKEAVWLKDKRTDVAIKIITRNVAVRDMERGQGFISVDMGELTILGCYVSPNIPLVEYKKEVDYIMKQVNGKRKDTIVTGDLNAKSPAWGAPITDKKGEYWMNHITSSDMIVMNTGGEPTFIRGRSKSHIDVTIATKKMSRHIIGWEVLDIDSHTEHRYICFEIVNGRSNIGMRCKITEEVDWDTFEACMKWTVDETGRTSHNECSKAIEEAYQNSLKRNKNRTLTKPYWWNRDIEQKRHMCNGTRRMLTRLAGRRLVDRRELIEIENKLKDLRRELKKMIQTSKKVHWRELQNELDNNIWGDAYRIVMRNLRFSLPFELHIDRKREVVRELFPMVQDTWTKRQTADEVQPFTVVEMTKAAEKMKNGKAPGIDRVPVEVIKEVVKKWPKWLVIVLNELLMRGEFPDEWKIGKVILLPKSEKTMEQLKAFRPICLLTSISKLFETMIRERLLEDIETKHNLHEHQYGFRRERSTIQAIERIYEVVAEANKRWSVLILLDVKNAFNTARHSLIIQELRRRNIKGYLINVISSYLSNRKITYGKGQEEVMEISAGVPQGSVLGPMLWNILYDGVLRVPLMGQAETIAFADDLALIISADDKESLIICANECLYRINRWMNLQKLSLAPNKTEAIIIKGPRKREGITFTLCETKVNTVKKVRYLGIYLDDRGTFGEHVMEIARKVETKLAVLTRIMPNVNGPGSAKREMLSSMVNNIILYGAPIWYRVLNIKKYKHVLQGIQRRVLLRVASAYRTVSTVALNVITGVLPIDLLIMERKELHESVEENKKLARRAVRDNATEKWQQRWNENVVTGQWTKRWIRNISEWIDCKHRRLDYWLTQALTGHGCFGSYTKRMNITEEDTCKYCKEVDDPEHTFFVCGRWAEDRQRAEEEMGCEITIDNVFEKMIESRQKWEIVSQMIRTILKRKREEWDAL